MKKHVLLVSFEGDGDTHIFTHENQQQLFTSLLHFITDDAALNYCSYEGSFSEEQIEARFPKSYVRIEVYH